MARKLEPLDLTASSTYNDRTLAAKINELVEVTNALVSKVTGEQETETETETKQ